MSPKLIRLLDCPYVGPYQVWNPKCKTVDARAFTKVQYENLQKTCLRGALCIRKFPKVDTFEILATCTCIPNMNILGEKLQMLERSQGCVTDAEAEAEADTKVLTKKCAPEKNKISTPQG